MKCRLLSSLFILLFTSAWAQSDLFKQWNDLDGTLGNKPIHLSLYFSENGEIKGHYYYTDNEKKILLSGHLTGEQLHLAVIKDGKAYGALEGKITTADSTTYIGQWFDKSRKQNLSFQLKLSYSSGGSYEHRYEPGAPYGTDQDVEAFVVALKKAIASGDKLWLADRVIYPFRQRVGTERIVYKNKPEFISKYDQIVTSAVVEKVKQQSGIDLYCNWQGVQFGGIWFRNSPNSTPKLYDFQIISIQ